MTGYCFWEKTTNGCKNKEDKFNHNAYDFYALCREGEHKEAEFQCKEKPGIPGPLLDVDDYGYPDHYFPPLDILDSIPDGYLPDQKKYCYDCEQGAWL